MELSKQQVKHLKSLAHHRKPIVRIGQNGVTENVVKELEIALNHHELVKIKVAAEDKKTRTEVVNGLCTQVEAVCIAITGGVALLYRQNPESAVIKF